MSDPIYKIVSGTEFSSKEDLSIGSKEATFDAFLSKDLYDPMNCKLTLQLRLRLQMINPDDSGEYPDANGNIFPIRIWKPHEWMNFIISAKAQANMWNNKFWLKPPPSFTKLDVEKDSARGQAYRPYIRCELEVDFYADAADAHTTIKVVNLDTDKMADQFRDAEIVPRFTANAALWDSVDQTPWIVPFKDERGLENTTEQHYTIAHEIGHALGLKHIGVLLRLPLCMVAATQEIGPDGSSEFQGGSQSSLVCYGYYTAHGANIMGAGSKFSVENAKPWVWAITSMEKASGDWEVLLHRPAEKGFLVRL